MSEIKRNQVLKMMTFHNLIYDWGKFPASRPDQFRTALERLGFLRLPVQIRCFNGDRNCQTAQQKKIRILHIIHSHSSC